MFTSVFSFGSQIARKLGLATACAPESATVFVRASAFASACALALVLAVASTATDVAYAKGVPDTGGAVTETVSLVNLPKEAQTTARLIRTGGPFPHDKDGVVFGNRERVLPKQQRGFYREYTVITPGARNRGARRMVCGGAVAVNPEACYYSDDHYASFRRVVP